MIEVMLIISAMEENFSDSFIGPESFIINIVTSFIIIVIAILMLAAQPLDRTILKIR